MEFRYTPELAAYMQRKGKRNILVDVAASDHSDFEVTELFYRFVPDSHAQYLKEKKKYHGYPTPVGEVLLPNYRLEYAPVVTFGLEKVLFFRRITVQGINL